MRSFQNVLAGTILAANASLGVMYPLDAKATPSPGEDWAYVGKEQEPCLPQFSVYFQLPERVIAIEQKAFCPVASQIYVHLANDIRRLPPIVATQSLTYPQKWVSQQDPVAATGTYGVLSVEYSPGRFVSRLNQRDHRIVIGGVQQTHPVAPQLTLEEEPPRSLSHSRRQNVSPERSQAQVLTLVLEPDSKILIGELIELLRWFKTNVPLLTAIIDRLEPLIRAIESIKTS